MIYLILIGWARKLLIYLCRNTSEKFQTRETKRGLKVKTI